MTDAHTPRLLSEADAAADLAGLPRPVSSEQAMANYTFTIVADSGYESTTEGRCSAKPYGAVIYALHNDDSYAEQRDKLVSERDALAGRVAELEAEVLDQCRLNGMGAERELALMSRVRELEAERERLTLSRADRECLRIGQELQRAASDLPEGFVIEIAVELGYGGVTLIDENYKTQDFTDTVDGLSHCITQAIDAALSTTPESKP